MQVYGLIDMHGYIIVLDINEKYVDDEKERYNRAGIETIAFSSDCYSDLNVEVKDRGCRMC